MDGTEETMDVLPFLTAFGMTIAGRKVLAITKEVTLIPRICLLVLRVCGSFPSAYSPGTVAEGYTWTLLADALSIGHN
eukprot:scaffold406801_cov30-Prasinocladus_malaysianus.AAC.1